MANLSQALADCPNHLVRRLYLIYGKLEEEHGLARRAINIYERATAKMENSQDLYEFYCLLVEKVRISIYIPLYVEILLHIVLF